MDGLEQGFIVAFVSAISGGIGVAIPLFIQWIKARQDVNRATRQDTIAEWKELADRLQKRADNQELSLAGIHRELLECEKRSGELMGEVKVLQMQVRRLQALAGDTSPGTIQSVIITSDLNGTILNVSPSIAPLLHFLPKDLFRQNIEVIVPERLRPLHREAFKKVAASGIAPDPDKAIITYALSKTGGEVPVTINVSGWQDLDGTWFLNAEIRKRFVKEGPTRIDD